ncbi:MAG TPA: glycine--tRNA ligase subunit beta [Rhodospirillaceae bacterium]|nr:MAG: glycine--tRNA ligase subunit beta [Alphaproteobacteria bacterium GWF2_58_20]HAU29599.1 glycine--tRNA ligase subunit beta [Rhodospirillaceae bacterium]
MSEFLLELYSEDIPARMQVKAGEDLLRLVTDKLKAGGITFGKAIPHSTPRRIVLVIDGLPESRPDVREEKRGPRTDAPDAAIAGFLRANSLESLDSCEQRDTGKGIFWFHTVEKKGGPTVDILREAICEAVAAFPWPKSMRWGETTMNWVRPLHHVLALFDGKTISGSIDNGDASDPLPFTNKSCGHRFLSPAHFEVKDFASLVQKLRAGKVILDREERKDIILKGAEALAQNEGFTLLRDDGLLEEVTGLVEWPVMLAGAIDSAFMDVPAEVLTTSMRINQKYFAMLRADGSLAPRFIVAANNATTDSGAAVVAGNERVLRARLSDAKFFWDQDRKTKLEARLPALAKITFHADLGTMEQKVARMEKLASRIADSVPGADTRLAHRAARLAKADLTSGVVGEFPELQGIMGSYYARHDGEDAAVAEAIALHYRPLGPSDSCPKAPLAITVALADKIDSLAGFFAIGAKPTGSKDPFALRRAALGILRLISENTLRRFPLRSILVMACDLYDHVDATKKRSSDETVSDIMAFFADRQKVALREEGFAHDVVDAVLATGDDDILRLHQKLAALSACLGSKDGTNLMATARRALNILDIELAKPDTILPKKRNNALLVEPAETALHAALSELTEKATHFVDTDDYAGLMTEIALLRPVLDAFFENITVNCPEPERRLARLQLLADVAQILTILGDFRKIGG